MLHYIEEIFHPTCIMSLVFSNNPFPSETCFESKTALTSQFAISAEFFRACLVAGVVEILESNRDLENLSLERHPFTGLVIF